MKPDYVDITSRLGRAIWHDDRGVPRYEAFHPKMLGVYDTYAALVKIECQACAAEMRVGIGVRRPNYMMRSDGDEPELPSEDGGIGSFHYGDPPMHDCPGAGETMNSLPVEVLEFWRRDGEKAGRDWHRDADHEVAWDDGIGAIFGPE